MESPKKFIEFSYSSSSSLPSLSPSSKLQSTASTSSYSSFNSSTSFSPIDISSNTPCETLFTQTSDESFVNMEKLCHDEVQLEKLINSMKKTDLNDTLDEIDFILQLGKKLKQQNEDSETENITDSIIELSSDEDTTLDDSVIEILH